MLKCGWKSIGILFVLKRWFDVVGWKPRHGLTWEELYKSELVVAWMVGFASALVLLILYNVILKIL